MPRLDTILRLVAALKSKTLKSKTATSSRGCGGTPAIWVGDENLA
jgi:hypothetical protein